MRTYKPFDWETDQDISTIEYFIDDYAYPDKPIVRPPAHMAKISSNDKPFDQLLDKTLFKATVTGYGFAGLLLGMELAGEDGMSQTSSLAATAGFIAYGALASNLRQRIPGQQG